MKRSIKPQVARRGIHEFAVRALAAVAGADASAADPYPAVTGEALTYDPYRKFKF
jgi:hypothetical protein